MLRPGCELTGGLASHCVLVAGTAIFRVPADLPDAAACPANCAGATVAAAIERAGPLAGKSVLVIGCGMLGVTTTAWVRELGAEHVIVCDVMPDRLGLAARWGATDTPSPAEVASLVIDRTGGHGADVVFEMTGSPEAFATTLSVPRMGGSVILVGPVFPSRPVPVAAEHLVRRCLAVCGVHNYAASHLKAALDFLASHSALPFHNLVTPWEPLTAFPRAVTEPLPPDKPRLGIRPQA